MSGLRPVISTGVVSLCLVMASDVYRSSISVSGDGDIVLLGVSNIAYFNACRQMRAAL